MKRVLVIGASVAILATTVTFAQEASDIISQTNPVSESDATVLSEEELRNAQPLEMPVLPEEETNRILGQPPVVEDEEVITIDPVEAGEQAEPEDRTDLSYGVVKRADVTIDPFRRGGKLFMNTGTCTAQFVGALDVIMTAAHCVYNRTSGWVTSIRFIRAYANGGGQSFDYQCAGILNGWTGGDPYPWDFAFVKMRGTSATGALGLKTGLTESEWISIGYPANFENAAYMQTVKGRKGTVGGSIGQMLDNPMTFGASGGAWITGNTVIGVNSFLRGNPADSKSLYGPVFNSNTVKLFNYVNGGCTG